MMEVFVVVVLMTMGIVLEIVEEVVIVRTKMEVFVVVVLMTMGIVLEIVEEVLIIVRTKMEVFVVVVLMTMGIVLEIVEEVLIIVRTKMEVFVVVMGVVIEVVIVVVLVLDMEILLPQPQQLLQHVRQELKLYQRRVSSFLYIFFSVISFILLHSNTFISLNNNRKNSSKPHQGT
jgi:hypothetical protein